MKPSQVFCRLRKYAGLPCGIGCGAGGFTENVNPIITLPALDFDPFFLSRFQPDELLKDQFTFLYSSVTVPTDGRWDQDGQSALWNFNLHYFEYLFPLWNAFLSTGKTAYRDKAFELIERWILHNPEKAGGAGWEAYTVDLRLTNWLSFYTYTREEIPEDLRRAMLHSIHDQYGFLSRHVEKDILGNHYFEDLKTLTLCAVFFGDGPMLEKAVSELRKECREEIPDDGVHFERSMMYHNLILESLMRTAAALRGYGRADAELESRIRPMLDAAWSMEGSLERLPLFNDAGNNVAKGPDAILAAAKTAFSLEPAYRTRFPDAGYYLFRKGSWTLIVDAGDPGPSYIPGHAHCDALSFELFRDGEPVAVNCGTCAYQSEHRSFFRSTAAHNTVSINQTEQSQCWGVFRMAKRSSVRVLSADDGSLSAEMKDQKGQTVTRCFRLSDDELTVTDTADHGLLTGYLHTLTDPGCTFDCASLRESEHMYAPEYGRYAMIRATEYAGDGRIALHICLKD